MHVGAMIHMTRMARERDMFGGCAARRRSGMSLVTSAHNELRRVMVHNMLVRGEPLKGHGEDAQQRKERRHSAARGAIEPD